jgi:hypothetical protein
MRAKGGVDGRKLGEVAGSSGRVFLSPLPAAGLPPRPLVVVNSNYTATLVD